MNDIDKAIDTDIDAAIEKNREAKTMKTLMTDCQRCPRCNRVPSVKVMADDTWELSCQDHGYVMTGPDLEHAVLYWNRVMDFFKHEMGRAA